MNDKYSLDWRGNEKLNLYIAIRKLVKYNQLVSNTMSFYICAQITLILNTLRCLYMGLLPDT